MWAKIPYCPAIMDDNNVNVMPSQIEAAIQ